MSCDHCFAFLHMFVIDNAITRALPKTVSSGKESIRWKQIFLTTGEHPFVFIDAQGCLSDTVLVNLSPISEDCLQIPTLFTPNGDTQNDIWQIGGIENFTEAKIRVYNRWGQLIFKSNGNYFGNEWDGTYNGDPLPFAVYYYTIDPVNENGTTYNGGVTIKR